MDHHLHENGEPCPACTLRREDHDLTEVLRPDVACNLCGGSGRISLDASSVVQRSVSWARAHYWPERERRWALQNRQIAR